MENKIVFNVVEAAEQLGVCRETVRRELCRGNLKGYKAGTRWRVTAESIAEYKNRMAS